LKNPERVQERVMPANMRWLGRFLTKLVFDILPTALASLIGGLLFTHYQWARVPEPVSAQVTPASAEMMALLRDEHALVANFLDARLAREKKQLAVDEEGPRATVTPQPAVAVSEPPLVAVATVAARPVGSRNKVPAAGATRPLVIARIQQDEEAKPASGDSDSLFARTIGIKDRVVAVTQRAVSVIGGIPSWIGSIGGRIGGVSTSAPLTDRLVSAS
jgi:hypothetical protein